MKEITASVKKVPLQRISQCDLFRDIEVIENIVEENFGEDKKIRISRIHFPCIIVLTQDCDLERDFENRNNDSKRNKNTSLLHIIVAPVLNFESYVEGKHWGNIFTIGERQKKGGSILDQLMKNESIRYHYLNFKDEDQLPELIIDFKHFFTVSSDMMYSLFNNRICSMDDLYKEKISQRFAYYLSRIGLPS